MQIKPSHLRWAVSGAAGLVLAPVISQFFVSAAEEAGLYKSPIESALVAIHALVGNAWFHWIGGALVGLAVGVWLDTFIRRKDVLASPPPPVEPAKFGAELQELSDDILRFIVEQRLARPAPTAVDARLSWEREQQLRDQETTIFEQRYGVRVQVAFSSLRALEIPVPFHAQVASSYTLGGLGKYFGLIAQYLLKNDLDAARAIDRETLWRMAV